MPGNIISNQWTAKKKKTKKKLWHSIIHMSGWLKLSRITIVNISKVLEQGELSFDAGIHWDEFGKQFDNIRQLCTMHDF